MIKLVERGGPSTLTSEGQAVPEAHVVTTKKVGQEQLAVMSMSKSVRASTHRIPFLPSTMPWYEKERPSSGGECMRHQLQAWSGSTHGQNCAHRGRALRFGRTSGWAGGATRPPVGTAVSFGRAVRLGRAAPGGPPWYLPGTTPWAPPWVLRRAPPVALPLAPPLAPPLAAPKVEPKAVPKACSSSADSFSFSWPGRFLLLFFLVLDGRLFSSFHHAGQISGNTARGTRHGARSTMHEAAASRNLYTPPIIGA